MRFFKPVTTMMNRLKYVQQFSFIGLVLGVPIIVMVFMFINDINNQIEGIEKRQEGAAYNTLLKDLLQDVQQHRGYSISYLIGNSFSAILMKEKQVKIQKDLQAIDQYDRVIGKSMKTSKTLQQIKDQWSEIETLIENMKVQEAMDLHNDYIETILEFMVVIADESELFLSDTDYAFYMVNDVIKTVPLLTEQLGQMRAIGMGAVEVKNVSDQQRILIDSLTSSIKSSVKGLEHGMDAVFSNYPSLKSTFDYSIWAVTTDTANFLDYVQQQLLDSPYINVDREEFFTLATKTIDASYELYNLETNEMTSMMEQEIETLKRNRFFMIALIFVALILTIYCFVGFYHSIKTSMEEMKTAGYLFSYRYLFSPQIQQAEFKCKETELKLHKVENQLSQQVLRAHESERKRVSRELHDGIGQSLYSILVTLNIVEKETMEKNKEKNMQNAKMMVANAMKEVKEIAHSLRPSVLDDLGIIPALKSFINDYEKIHDIHVEFQFTGDKERMPPETETALYRICQEALANAAKYAKASFVHVSVHHSEKEIYLVIHDNGNGFSLKEYLEDSQRKGIGLFSMKERTEGIGGSFEISSKPNKGTRIEVCVPRNDS